MPEPTDDSNVDLARLELARLWAEFIRVRYELIKHMSEVGGFDSEDIALSLSMRPTQPKDILESVAAVEELHRAAEQKRKQIKGDDA